MKKLQKLMLVAVLGLGGASFANETSSQNSYNNKASSTQTSQSTQSNNEATHRYAVGLSYSIPWITMSGGSPRKTYSSYFDNAYLVGSYQILYPSKKYSHIANGMEFMAGLGYVNYGCDGDILVCVIGDSKSGFGLSLGMLDVTYRPISNNLRLGVKVGIEYNMMYFPSDINSILYHSYGPLLGLEIDHNKFSLGFLAGYYFTHLYKNGEAVYNTWSSAGDGISFWSYKLQVYTLYRF